MDQRGLQSCKEEGGRLQRAPRDGFESPSLARALESGPEARPIRKQSLMLPGLLRRIGANAGFG